MEKVYQQCMKLWFMEKEIQYRVKDCLINMINTFIIKKMDGYINKLELEKQEQKLILVMHNNRKERKNSSNRLWIIIQKYDDQIEI